MSGASNITGSCSASRGKPNIAVTKGNLTQAYGSLLPTEASRVPRSDFLISCIVETTDYATDRLLVILGVTFRDKWRGFFNAMCR